jgi:hypothetical protein
MTIIQLELCGSKNQSLNQNKKKKKKRVNFQCQIIQLYGSWQMYEIMRDY